MEKYGEIKSGTCPACGSDEVYSNKNATHYSGGGVIDITGSIGFVLNTYLCVKCGYYEKLVNEEDLARESIINAIKKKWEKV